MFTSLAADVYPGRQDEEFRGNETLGAAGVTMRRTIDTATRLCAVIGHPVAHSLSPVMHNAAFEALGLNYVYLAFSVSDVAGCLAGMRAMEGFRGLSVTIPHKVEVMRHLDEVVPLARRVGCVNTVCNDDGRLVGSITDGLGTLRAFERAGVDLDDKTVLFIGAGGAARAVAFALAESCRLREMLLLGRTPARVASLVDDLRRAASIPIEGGSLGRDLRAALTEADVVIQATPLGMHGHAEGDSGVPGEWLHSDQVVFDMVYRPMRTKLIEDATAKGCKVVLGLEMLLHQAILQFERWTEREAPEQVMRQALEQALRDAS